MMVVRCCVSVVFSAHAEVVPLISISVPEASCILRARGGSSVVRNVFNPSTKYSPRTRR